MRCVVFVYTMEREADDQCIAATRLSTRLSPVAIPKSYLGLGLDHPETPEANNEAAVIFSPIGLPFSRSDSHAK